MKESEFQKKFLDKVKQEIPGCKAIKNDAQYLQGIFDWTVYRGSKFAGLELKKSKTAHHQPNQEYYINDLNDKGGFGRFVYPENQDEVLKEMVEYFNK
jgi:hypothetical protein